MPGWMPASVKIIRVAGASAAPWPPGGEFLFAGAKRVAGVAVTHRGPSLARPATMVPRLALGGQDRSHDARRMYVAASGSGSSAGGGERATARRYNTIDTRAGKHIITAASPRPGDLR